MRITQHLPYVCKEQVGGAIASLVFYLQAYCFCFTLTTLALVRAQVTSGGGMNAFNWINIALFAVLAGGYGWFSFFERISVFEGLGVTET
jgi:hypothetical protein